MGCKLCILVLVGFFKKSPQQIERKKAILRKKELKKLVKEKKYDKVLKVGTEILEKIPEENDVLFIMGGIYYMKNRYKTAIEFFDRALKMTSYDPEILILKANSLLKIGKLEEAILCCKKIQEFDPKNIAVTKLLEKINSMK